MPQVEKLSVFLASPGDVPTERRHVEEIVAELNRTVASDKGVVLQVVRWENDAFPGYGQDAQTLINEQIAEMSKYALFVGIMWNRLGTPTSRATSGTVEEFERAVQASKQNGQPDIWFYFRDSASKLDTEDQLEQRKKVLAFKEEVKANGMPWTYKNPADFRDKLRTQMILWLNTFEKRTVTNQDAEPLSPTEFVDDRVKQAAVILDRARAKFPYDEVAGQNARFVIQSINLSRRTFHRPLRHAGMGISLARRRPNPSALQGIRSIRRSGSASFVTAVPRVDRQYFTIL